MGHVIGSLPPWGITGLNSQLVDWIPLRSLWVFEEWTSKWCISLSLKNISVRQDTWALEGEEFLHWGWRIDMVQALPGNHPFFFFFFFLAYLFIWKAESQGHRDREREGEKESLSVGLLPRRSNSRRRGNSFGSLQMHMIAGGICKKTGAAWYWGCWTRGDGCVHAWKGR